MKTRYSSICRIMGGIRNEKSNKDWTAGRTTREVPCYGC